MEYFVKETKHLSRGYASIDFGWGNGYVCIPEGHPCHGLGSDAIHDQFTIDCNGGLTFARPASDLKDWPELPQGCEKCWVVGFDTAHYGDSLEIWPEHMVRHEALRLANQFDLIK